MKQLNPEKISILLVEDDKDFKTSLTNRLVKRKYAVTAVESAENALKKLESNTFDVIISDIKLTGMDGVEFLSLVKKIDEDLPVILMTGFANLESARKAVALNAFEYLVKPLDNIDELLTPIQNAVQSYKLIKENIILKERYENIVSAVPDAILTINTSLIIESANKTFYKMFNMTEEITNKNVNEVFDDIILEKITYLINSIGLEANSTRFEWMSLEFSDQIFWADITLKYAIIGEKENILMVISDITDLKETEEKKKKIELQFLRVQKQEALGNLTSGIAHEFNNILSIILGHVQLSLSEDSLPEIKQSLLEIEKSTYRGSSLVENMSAFANPNTPNLRKQNISEVIDDVLGLQKRQLHLQNIIVEKEYLNESVTLFDRGQMEQVFLNLLINAMHAIIPKGKGTISITIQDIDNYVEINFTDTGIGMSENTQRKIFNPFFTTKGAWAKDELGISGTGLGLSVSSTIIEQHDGIISAKSEPDKGSVITIKLPAFNSTKAPEATSQIKLSDVDFEKIKNLRILLVDDEEDMVKLLKRIFQKAGFQNVIVEQGGKEAIASFTDFNPDIVFLDMIMPDMNGKQVFTKIKSINESIPIVFMSGKIDIEKDKIINEKTFDFIKKPFNINDLYHILNRVMALGKYKRANIEQIIL